jgi:putative ABC transport system substrate-binding protein
LEVRFAEGSPDELPDLVRELASLGVSVIVASGTPASQAAKTVTTTIPVIMVNVGDPIQTGLASSLPHPGGNLTGITNITTELSAKRLELLKEAVPHISRVEVLWIRDGLIRERNLRETEEAARVLGLHLESMEIDGIADIESGVDAAARNGADAIILLPSPRLAWGLRCPCKFLGQLPGMYSARGMVAAGGLMSYGPNLVELTRRAAYYVDRILRGTNPADLPIERPMTFEFVVNLKTARELGITFPQEILLQVTEVVQ